MAPAETGAHSHINIIKCTTPHPGRPNGMERNYLHIVLAGMTYEATFITSTTTSFHIIGAGIVSPTQQI
jgi:hypothetical protein